MEREKKRKLPARAAARSDQVSKKRATVTPSTERSTPPVEASEEPSPSPAPTPDPQRVPLPTSLSSNKPLPTIETAQEDLSVKDYQSIQESGVLSESLARSRKIWQESMFERYWTKPKATKKKAAPEDPSNPRKDSMIRVGHATIKVEPHVFEVTMFTIKQLHQTPLSEPTASQTSQTPQAHSASRFRPVLQYGPPGGELSRGPSAPPTPGPQAAVADTTTTTTTAITATPPAPAASSAPAASPAPAASTPSSLPAPTATLASVVVGTPVQAPPLGPSSASSTPTIPNPAQTTTPAANAPRPVLPHPPATSQSPHVSPVVDPNSHNGGPPQQAPPKAGEKDPIITTLAERASDDPWLRDVMKRVASGTAAPEELARFQKLIDKIATDFKRKNTPGPPAETLFVDGRSVADYAVEVSHILSIVLAANADERGSTVRVPSGCSTLVEGLLRAALDDTSIADSVRRLAAKRPANPDSLDVKDLLESVLMERLRKGLPVVRRGVQPQAVRPSPAPAPVRKETAARARSAECDGVVLEFSGGDGHRYLFPKYSILQYEAGGQQVLASFLIVRRGGAGEEGDPGLDYWEPVTIRISGKHVDLFRSVVAPEEEVRRYMDSIKRTMTRAEFVLLAMRLPREEGDKNSRDKDGKDKESKDKDSIRDEGSEATPVPLKPPPVMWAVRKTQSPAPKRPVDDDDRQQVKYQKFVASVAGAEE